MSLSTKIKQIQQADYKTKLRWLVASTIISMILVLAIWIGFTKSVVFNAGRQPLVGASQTNEPGFLKILGAGISSIVQSLRERTANTINYFQNRASKTNTFVITPTTNTTGTIQ